MKRGRILVLVGISGLAYLLWPLPVRPAILYAYSDNAFGMWGLTLYKDGEFDLTLPAAQESGSFKVVGDTVELHYNAKMNGLPAAYLLNREKRKIDELQKIDGRWAVSENNNWAMLHFDSTRYYTR